MPHSEFQKWPSNKAKYDSEYERIFPRDKTNNLGRGAIESERKANGDEIKENVKKELGGS